VFWLTLISQFTVGSARVLSYEDIVEAQRQRDIKEARGQACQGRRGPKRSQSSPAQVTGKRTRSQEIEEVENEIREAGLKKYCSVLSF
jgi:hypothetical protein